MGKPGKGQAKGKKGNKPDILSTIQEALPQAAKVRAHPILVAEQWMVPTRRPEDMGPYPLVPRHLSGV
eukprot:3520979-Amphidinium_carterae.1